MSTSRRHVVAQHAGVALAVQPLAGGVGDGRGALRPALGERRVGAQPPGHLELAAEPAGGVAARRPGPAGRASPGRGRCGRRSRPSRRRRPRRRPGTASPCRGNGGRSHPGTARSPPPAGGPWHPRSRSGRSRPAPRRGSRGGGRRAGPGSPGARVDRVRRRPVLAIRTYGLRVTAAARPAALAHRGRPRRGRRTAGWWPPRCRPRTAWCAPARRSTRRPAAGSGAASGRC